MMNWEQWEEKLAMAATTIQEMSEEARQTIVRINRESRQRRSESRETPDYEDIERRASLTRCLNPFSDKAIQVMEWNEIEEGIKLHAKSCLGVKEIPINETMVDKGFRTAITEVLVGDGGKCRLDSREILREVMKLKATDEEQRKILAKLHDVTDGLKKELSGCDLKWRTMLSSAISEDGHLLPWDSIKHYVNGAALRDRQNAKAPESPDIMAFRIEMKDKLNIKSEYPPTLGDIKEEVEKALKKKSTAKTKKRIEELKKTIADQSMEIFNSKALAGTLEDASRIISVNHERELNEARTRASILEKECKKRASSKEFMYQLMDQVAEAVGFDENYKPPVLLRRVRRAVRDSRIIDTMTGINEP